MSVLKLVKRKTAKQAAIETLEQFISGNSLKSGDALPSELTLSEDLGISRNIIREAVQHFKSLGIVRQNNKGLFVNELVPSDPYKQYRPYVKKRRQCLDELRRFRMIFEIGIIPELVQKATGEDIKKLRGLADKMDREKDPYKLTDLDCEFHSYLFEILDNMLLMSLKPTIIDFFQEMKSRKNAGFEKDSVKTMGMEHLRYVDLLKKKNKKGLISLIEEHFV